MKPRLAILDEPAAGIDMLPINHIIDIIHTLKAAGGSVLVITCVRCAVAEKGSRGGH